MMLGEFSLASSTSIPIVLSRAVYESEVRTAVPRVEDEEL